MTHLQIAIDDGSSYIKTAYQSKHGLRTCITPSRVIRQAIVTETGYSDASYEIDGYQYSVVKQAVGTIPTNNREYQTSEANRVLINHAIKIANYSDYFATCDIVLTIPVSQFFNPDGSVNNERIQEKIDNAKGEIKSLDNKKLAEIKKVYVMPEGVPAFNHVKSENKLDDGRYLLVDIGGTTTDLVIIDDNGEIENFLSINIGALAMIQEFKQHCLAKLRLNELSEDLALGGLLSGLVAGQDMGNEARLCVRNFSAKLKDNVGQLGDLQLFDGVICSGGGSTLTPIHENQIQTKQTQLDNAIGCLEIFEE